MQMEAAARLQAERSQMLQEAARQEALAQLVDAERTQENQRDLLQRVVLAEQQVEDAQALAAQAEESAMQAEQNARRSEQLIAELRAELAQVKQELAEEKAKPKLPEP